VPPKNTCARTDGDDEQDDVQLLDGLKLLDRKGGEEVGGVVQAVGHVVRGDLVDPHVAVVFLWCVVVASWLLFFVRQGLATARAGVVVQVFWFFGSEAQARSARKTNKQRQHQTTTTHLVALGSDSAIGSAASAVSSSAKRVISASRPWCVAA
jgi:hypothetical protein